MITVGITGGIGAGKTTVCRELEALGALVFYADDVAKQLMTDNENVRKAISQSFGDNSYNSDGGLNKTHLIREAFKKNRVQELNEIVHPAVGEAFRKTCEYAREAGKKMVVKEAALLFKEGRPEGIDIIVIVKSSSRERVQRVMDRDSVEKEDVLDRISKQPDFDKMEKYADYIIENDGTFQQLTEKARQLYHQIIEEKKIE